MTISNKKSTTFIALAIAVIFTLAGIAILYSINAKSALFGAISIFLYTCAYTPLKSVTPLAVFVGAFPGAIPPMLGYVAATNDFGLIPRKSRTRGNARVIRRSRNSHM